MKNKNLTICLLLTSVWLAAPVLVSAKGLPYSAESLGAHNSFIHKVQKIEDFSAKSHVSSYDGEAFKGSSGDKSSGTGMRSYSDSLGPSFDIHPGAKGDTSSSGPWWDRRSSGDPSVKDLSGMDGGGFAPPGSYTGSERRF
ncbi:MAG: hypothetical protein H8K03_14485 [Nitrospira sp.]